MTDITKVDPNTSHYDYKKNKSPVEEFDLESEGHKVAVEKNKKGGNSGPAYILQLSPEAIKKLQEKKS